MGTNAAQGRAGGDALAEKAASINECVELHDVLTHIFSHVGEHQGGSALTRCEGVCRGWLECSKDPMLEPTWRQLCLRMSPAAPIVADDDDDDSYVCTAFTNPAVEGVLATCANLGDKLSFRLLFQRRMRAAAAAHAANRVLGTTYPDLGVEVPLYCCTTKALVPSSFKYEDLSFTFELFQDDSERQERIGYMKHWNEDCREDNPDEEFEEYEDYLSQTVLSNYAAPPHYVNAAANFKENLIWCSTVRGEPDGVYAAAPCTNDRIARRTSVGIDTLMDDYHSEWCRPYRMVVTATRNTDGKMCQIVDVVCRDGQGFKEVGGDTTTGGVSFMVVPADGDDGKDDKLLDDDSEIESDEDRGLSVYCFFGSNEYNKRIEQQLEEPGGDEKVDKAWDGMMTAAYESLGALFLLSIEWNNNDPLQIAEALGTLEWY